MDVEQKDTRKISRQIAVREGKIAVKIYTNPEEITIHACDE